MFLLYQNHLHSIKTTPTPSTQSQASDMTCQSRHRVILTVYDLMGREVIQLTNTIQEAGFRSVQWNATDMHGKPVSAGVYLYQIRAGEFVQTRKMVLLK